MIFRISKDLTTFGNGGGKRIPDAPSPARLPGKVGSVPLGEILHRRAAPGSNGMPTRRHPARSAEPSGDPATPKSVSGCGRSSKTSRRELGDEAPLASTVTRTLKIFKTAGVPPEQWSDLLYQARGLTQEHTAQIRKLAGNGETASGARTRCRTSCPHWSSSSDYGQSLRDRLDHERPRRETTALAGSRADTNRSPSL